MKALLVTLAVVVIAVVALGAFAPASLVDAGLASHTEGQLRLANAEGTIWRGAGTLSVDKGRLNLPIAWQVDAASLFRGAPAITLVDSGDASAFRGRAAVAKDRIAIDDLQGTLPGSAIGAFAGVGTITGGSVDVRASGLVLSPRAASGAVTFDWKNARAQVADVLADLGTVRLRLTANGDAFTGPVTSEGGMARIDGTVTLRDERVAAQVRIAPTPHASPQVRQAIEAIGRPDASGNVSVRLDRALR